MKIRRLLPFLSIFILIISLVFLSGCFAMDMIDKILGEYSDDPLRTDEKVIDEALVAAEEIGETDKIIKYYADLKGTHYEHLEGFEIVLIVNFKTSEVEVEVNGGENSFTISGEIINKETFEIFAYSSDTIINNVAGHISEDLSMFEGSLLSKSINYHFIASRE